MATTFTKCLEHTLKWEGGFVDDPDDPGGVTNHGISLRFLLQIANRDGSEVINRYDFDHDGNLNHIDIKNLSKEQAAELYKQEFWNELYYELPEGLAIKLFDLSVNMGVKQAVLLLQRELGCRPYDGIYGSKTHQWTMCSQKDSLSLLVASAARFYFNLAEKRPASRKYLFGWLRRCYDV